jgi:endonuclease YncB( thermonuclease family)
MNALRSFHTALIALSLYLPLSAQATNIYGKVVGISDGDTITILTEDKQNIKIRLVEIDAPEKNQPWGQKSKQALSDLVFSLNVKVDSSGQDRYGRTLGTVFLSDTNINKHMVENGNAWAYTQYVRDQNYFVLQKNAESKQLGLWSLSQDQITPPWEWRRKKK